MIATKFIETTVDLQKSLLSVAWNDMLFLIFKSFEMKKLEFRRGIETLDILRYYFQYCFNVNGFAKDLKDFLLVLNIGQVKLIR